MGGMKKFSGDQARGGEDFKGGARERERGREGEGWIVGDGRTDERLGNQPANGTREPHQRRELFRQP